MGAVLGGWKECRVSGSSVGWVEGLLGGWEQCWVGGRSVG